jgi:hypothetical protein
MDIGPDEPLDDALDPTYTRIIDAPRELWTDGVYVWPADLAYYVERYHARLPRSFWYHARDNEWRIASGIDPTRLSMRRDALASETT